MNTDRIHKDFAELIRPKGVYKKLGLMPGTVRIMRYNLKHGRTISLDKKLQLLQQNGWHQDEVAFTRNDMVSFAKFVLQSGAAAKDLGAPYLFDKWRNKNEV